MDVFFFFKQRVFAHTGLLCVTTNLTVKFRLQLNGGREGG